MHIGQLLLVYSYLKDIPGSYSCHYFNVSSDDVMAAMIGTQTKRNIFTKTADLCVRVHSSQPPGT